jgi:hypothetical protein
MRAFAYDKNNEMVSLLPKGESLFNADIHAIGPYFYRVGFHVVTLSTGVAAVPDIEFITVQRANYITNGVDISIGKDPAGVRAFVCESEDLLIMTADADRFSAAFHNNYVIF